MGQHIFLFVIYWSRDGPIVPWWLSWKLIGVQDGHGSRNGSHRIPVYPPFWRIKRTINYLAVYSSFWNGIIALNGAKCCISMVRLMGGAVIVCREMGEQITSTCQRIPWNYTLNHWLTSNLLKLPGEAKPPLENCVAVSTMDSRSIH